MAKRRVDAPASALGDLNRPNPIPMGFWIRREFPRAFGLRNPLLCHSNAVGIEGRDAYLRQQRIDTAS